MLVKPVNQMKRITNVLVMNVTDRGVVAQVESTHTQGSQLCFLSHARAKSFGIEVPTKEGTWTAKSANARKKAGAFAKFAEEHTQLIEANLATYPLTIRDEPWMIERNGDVTKEQWQGLQAVD